MKLTGKTVGFALTGSYCTLSKVLPELEKLAREDIKLIPIISDKVLNNDTRFGRADDWVEKIMSLTDENMIDSIVKAEPIGPGKLLDLLIVAPCTGNTLAKIASGIIDETVVMAVKAHLRNERPVLLAVATNDGLSFNAGSFSKLLNMENIFFVPFGQDNPVEKPNSLVARMDLIENAAELALESRQIQPAIIEYNGIE